MLVALLLAALLLAIGNVVFWRFDPHQRLWRRLLKIVAALAITAIVSHYFGTVGVVIWFILAALPVVYVHAIWLPLHGINGWTAEPRDKYHALRGWPPPPQRQHGLRQQDSLQADGAARK
jgi:hypothetical protein